VEYLKQRNTVTRELVEELFEYATFTASDGTTLPYRLYVPYEYDPDKEYPVLVVLHGAGERGTDNKGNIFHMLHDMFSHADTPLSEAIIIAPQCPGAPNQWVDTPWVNGNYSVDRVSMSNELSAVLELLWEIEDEFSTDDDRYYITGLSMGGFGTWDMIMRYPDVFAAAVPICGGADPSYAAEICDMPIYTVHGSADPTVPVAGTRAMVEALKALGCPIIYQELEGEGHGVWNWAAQNADVWEWLFSQK
jgi:predicted peptidase